MLVRLFLLKNASDAHMREHAGQKIFEEGVIRGGSTPYNISTTVKTRDYGILRA